MRYDKNGISLYPNPATDGFNVSVDSKLNREDIQLELINVKGQVIDSRMISSLQAADYFFVTRNITPGVYSLKISRSKALLDVKQVIIK